ncbi:MAG: helix-turn-helix transcriptional regulator [Bacteroidales bacterium]|nr:helix-turn-helix transcriptional regulator [Bacteroidales bacterium]
MKERLQEIMEKEGMNAGRFADAIGIQRSALSHIMSGRNNPSLDVLMKVISRFDYISTDWLMFGKGAMLKHQNEEKNSSNLHTNELFPDNLSIESIESKEIGSKQPLNVDNITKNEAIIPQKEVVIKEVEKTKTISKIMIFYTDNTFENFIPEKVALDGKKSGTEK